MLWIDGIKDVTHINMQEFKNNTGEGTEFSKGSTTAENGQICLNEYINVRAVKYSDAIQHKE